MAIAKQLRLGQLGTTEQPFEQLVARSTGEVCAVRDTFAVGNIEALNGMPPQGATI